MAPLPLDTPLVANESRREVRVSGNCQPSSMDRGLTSNQDQDLISKAHIKPSTAESFADYNFMQNLDSTNDQNLGRYYSTPAPTYGDESTVLTNLDDYRQPMNPHPSMYAENAAYQPYWNGNPCASSSFTADPFCQNYAAQQGVQPYDVESYEPIEMSLAGDYNRNIHYDYTMKGGCEPIYQSGQPVDLIMLNARATLWTEEKDHMNDHSRQQPQGMSNPGNSDHQEWANDNMPRDSATDYSLGNDPNRLIHQFSTSSCHGCVTPPYIRFGSVNIPVANSADRNGTYICAGSNYPYHNVLPFRTNEDGSASHQQCQIQEPNSTILRQESLARSRLDFMPVGEQQSVVHAESPSEASEVNSEAKDNYLLIDFMQESPIRVQFIGSENFDSTKCKEAVLHSRSIETLVNQRIHCKLIRSSQHDQGNMVFWGVLKFLGPNGVRCQKIVCTRWHCSSNYYQREIPLCCCKGSCRGQIVVYIQENDLTIKLEKEHTESDCLKNLFEVLRTDLRNMMEELHLPNVDTRLNQEAQKDQLTKVKDVSIGDFKNLLVQLKDTLENQYKLDISQEDFWQYFAFRKKSKQMQNDGDRLFFMRVYSTEEEKRRNRDKQASYPEKRKEHKESMLRKRVEEALKKIGWSVEL